MRHLRDLHNAPGYQISILWVPSHNTIFLASVLEYDKCIQTVRIVKNEFLGLAKYDEEKIFF